MELVKSVLPQLSSATDTSKNLTNSQTPIPKSVAACGNHIHHPR